MDGCGPIVRCPLRPIPRTRRCAAPPRPTTVPGGNARDGPTPRPPPCNARLARPPPCKSRPARPPPCDVRLARPPWCDARLARPRCATHRGVSSGGRGAGEDEGAGGAGVGAPAVGDPDGAVDLGDDGGTDGRVALDRGEVADVDRRRHRCGGPEGHDLHGRVGAGVAVAPLVLGVERGDRCDADLVALTPVPAVQGLVEDQRPARRAPEDGPQVITATDVSFTYPGAALPALDGVTFDLKRGEVIALVGENGAGKSTLAGILTGLYLPTQGTVRWDGIDLADADPAGVLSKVALVPQDYTRWPLAARENITLGQPRPDGDTAVHAAAEAAGADTVLAALPHGLDTSLARSWWGGHDLSGGQWQRIAVARAFHRDAPVLVMDEPTAALDARAEHLIYSRLRALAAGRATVFITHRLANARLADRMVIWSWR